MSNVINQEIERQPDNSSTIYIVPQQKARDARTGYLRRWKQPSSSPNFPDHKRGGSQGHLGLAWLELWYYRCVTHFIYLTYCAWVWGSMMPWKRIPTIQQRRVSTRCPAMAKPVCMQHKNTHQSTSKYKIAHTKILTYPGELRCAERLTYRDETAKNSVLYYTSVLQTMITSCLSISAIWHVCLLSCSGCCVISRKQTRYTHSILMCAMQYVATSGACRAPSGYLRCASTRPTIIPSLSYCTRKRNHTQAKPNTRHSSTSFCRNNLNQSRSTPRVLSSLLLSPTNIALLTTNRRNQRAVVIQPDLWSTLRSCTLQYPQCYVLKIHIPVLEYRSVIYLGIHLEPQ